MVVLRPYACIEGDFMAHCFRCGVQLDQRTEHSRRLVYNGLSISSTRWSWRRHRSMQSLCSTCGTRHDRIRVLQWLAFGALTTGLFVSAMFEPRQIDVRVVTVAIDAANIRNGPSQDAAVVATAQRGSTFVVLSGKTGWYRIASTKRRNVPIGYVSLYSVSDSPDK
jgi:hypothetical protein